MPAHEVPKTDAHEEAATTGGRIQSATLTLPAEGPKLKRGAVSRASAFHAKHYSPFGYSDGW